MTIAMGHALYATGYKPAPEKPINPILQELLDYVNSTEYKNLILKEQDGNKNEPLTS